MLLGRFWKPQNGSIAVLPGYRTSEDSHLEWSASERY